MKFYILDFHVNLSRNPIFGYNWTTISVTVYEDLLVMWICHITVVQKTIFLYCWQWHVVQQCTQNTLLHFHSRNC